MTIEDKNKSRVEVNFTENRIISFGERITLEYKYGANEIWLYLFNEEDTDCEIIILNSRQASVLAHALSQAAEISESDLSKYNKLKEEVDIKTYGTNKIIWCDNKNE